MYAQALQFYFREVLILQGSPIAYIFTYYHHLEKLENLIFVSTLFNFNALTGGLLSVQ